MRRDVNIDRKRVGVGEEQAVREGHEARISAVRRDLEGNGSTTCIR